MGLQKLVDSYKKNPSSYLKNRIIIEAIPLIRSIVSKVNKPSTPLFDYDDLFNVGAAGLLQSLDSYSATKEVKFNTFAYYRIRGSIIDYIRSIDELSRTNRSRYGAAQKAVAELEQRLGRIPENEEVAKEIGLDIKDYEQLLITVQQRVALSLDMDIYGSDSITFGASLEETMYGMPDQELLQEEESMQLKEAIRNLKEREQLILAMYYFEDYNLREIAEHFELSEARISQIIGKLLLTLKSILKQPVLVC